MHRWSALVLALARRSVENAPMRLCHTLVWTPISLSLLFGCGANEPAKPAATPNAATRPAATRQLWPLPKGLTREDVLPAGGPQLMGEAATLSLGMAEEDVRAAQPSLFDFSGSVRGTFRDGRLASIELRVTRDQWSRDRFLADAKEIWGAPLIDRNDDLRWLNPTAGLRAVYAAEVLSVDRYTALPKLLERLASLTTTMASMSEADLDATFEPFRQPHRQGLELWPMGCSSFSPRVSTEVRNGRPKVEVSVEFEGCRGFRERAFEAMEAALGKANLQSQEAKRWTFANAPGIEAREWDDSWGIDVRPAASD
jgi:hypothetical protein